MMEADSIDLKDATVLVVDDVHDNLNVLRQTLEPEGYSLLLAPSGKIALEIAQRQRPDLILLDIIMPEMNGFETCRRLKADEQTASVPVIFVTAKTEMDSVIEGFDTGGVDYITKPFHSQEVLARVKTHLSLSRLTKALSEKNRELEKRTVALSEANQELLRTNERLQKEIKKRQEAESARDHVTQQLDAISEQEAKRWGISSFVGQSQTIQRVLTDIRKLQDVDKTSVLILGESGTGKELIARAIHFGGARSKGPFIPVNCAAIPGELAESSFFGHVQGAFTGASTNRKGHFELANGGTLFLDEIGEMPLDLQAKLLRALEDHAITPVGGNHQREIDVRIIAATNADLQTRIAAGAFRRDLYFRLAGFTVLVPPLRQRREDIALLTEHFLSTLAEGMGREKAQLSPEAITALENYHWPGNIRELRNVIEHALIRSGEGQIQREHLHLIQPSTNPHTHPGQPIPDTASASSGIRPSAHAADKILAYVRQHGQITNPECRTLLQCNYHHASYLLKKLNREEKLVRKGQHRWSYYRLP